MSRASSEAMTHVRSAPESEHLRAAHAAADALFAAQHDAREDPAVLQLIDGLNNVRERAQRLTVVERPVRRLPGAAGRGPAHSDPSDAGHAAVSEEIGAESDLRVSLTELRRRIAAARVSVPRSAMDAAVLSQAVQKAAEIEKEVSTTLAARDPSRGGRLRELARRLGVRNLRDRDVSGSMALDGFAQTSGDGESEAPPPTLSSATSHRSALLIGKRARR